MKTTRSNNYLAHSLHEFSDYHIETAEKIYSLLASGTLQELGQIINNIPEDEKWYVSFAFYDKYGFGYMKKIHGMTKDYNELMKYNLN